MFYKLDSTRFTLKEYWWGTPNPLVLFGWIAKWLRIQVPGSVDDPSVESLEPFRSSPETWPDEVQAKFHAAHEEFEALGFHTPVCYRIHDAATQTDIYQVVYLHKAGQAVARIHYRVWSIMKPPRQYFYPTFLTRFRDGGYLLSTAGKPDILAPPSCRVHREVGASAGKLWEAHQRQMRESWSGGSVVPVRDQRELTEAVESHHRTVRDFHVERGVFVPMPAEEEATVAAAALPAAGAGPAPDRNSAVLSEIERLQTKSSSWVSALVILAVSVGLFVGIGAAKWSWELLLLLLPVLFVHEMGHYLAMRLFHYRNVRMFFIPLFGAAVSGRHYNVPGWKRAVVSLMGPVPGILLGMGLGIAGIAAGIQPLIDVAMLALILNGFNLLPILPLDGGWVMHAIVFSRHFVLDAAFRLLAVGGLMLVSLLTGDRFLLFIGIAMLVGLPTVFRLVRVVRTLRRRGVAAASPDDQSIPPETAGTIIDEIRTTFPGAMTNKTLAQMTVQAFETLNARPPGWLATFALAGVHFGAFVLAVICASVFFIARHGGFREFFAAAAAAPQNVVDRGSIQIRRGAEAVLPAQQQKTIVATFESQDRAKAEFERLAGQVPPKATLRQFGQSLLLAVPGDDERTRDEWFTRLEGVTAEVHVSNGGANSPVRLVAIAPTEQSAVKLEESLQCYFTGSPDMWLVPPWHPELRITPEQERARQTYRRLVHSSGDSDAPELVSIRKKMADASRRGNTAKTMELRKEMADVQKRLAEARLERLAREAGGKAEQEVVALYRSRPEMDWDAEWIDGGEAEEAEKPDAHAAAPVDPARQAALNAARKKMEQYERDHAAWNRKMGALLGQLPLEGDGAKPNDQRFCAHGGVTRSGLLLLFEFLAFESLIDGPPTLVEWLDDQKCAGLKYEFIGGFWPAEEEP